MPLSSIFHLQHQHQSESQKLFRSCKLPRSPLLHQESDHSLVSVSARARAMAAKTLLILTGLLITYATVTVADVCDTSQLIPCLPAAKPNPEPPTGQCCNLIHALTSECLCAALQSSLAKVEGIDFNMALRLPHKCGRYFPKGTKCGDTAVPNGVEHGVDHHVAMEHGMDHHDTMDHEMEQQQSIEYGMDHHENQETKEQHAEEHQHAMENEMNQEMDHTMERQMENEMEH